MLGATPGTNPAEFMPYRYCEFCGSLMDRKTWAGKKETLKNYADRRFCDKVCAGSWKAAARRATTPLSPGTIYHQTKVDGTTRLEHRAIVERELGRKLETLEYVHHKNGIKTDNRLENLEIVTPAEHAKLHNQILPVEKVCVVCSTVFVPHKTKRRRQQTCGDPACKHELMRRNSSQRKLSDGQVAEIRALRAGGALLRELAGWYGVTETHISYIVRGKARQHCVDADRRIGVEDAVS